MRYLGIDYGTKRIGLALSDEEGSLAFPHRIIEAREGTFEDIVALIDKENVGAVVLGESKDLSGAPNKVMESIEGLKLALEARGVAVHYEPEFMTSAQAARPPEGEARPVASPSARGKEGPVDASAAALILQGYIDRMKNANA
jgi:putative holliday junction resolvase